ncbi:MAG: type II toxin-antitoxin system RelE/ParE family toxin [Hydrogenovibrio sp.]|uniref:type II toxin-antitoxin system RelE/ParE family toxin n=1 Tax=Hydrogenovibrio TaxID=28884 RepID=UPI00035D6A2B|nr:MULTISPECIES: type II toxin-antitoxin system RelE/ParE family toxin [Hydrogenovibrio]MDR9498176.1 type II toxin-antitoxin system RelE/ParE family toxin [Hydrogenovibrio sp.]
MKTVIAENARVTLLEAKHHYNNEQPGLGYDFLQEFTKALERIQAQPEAWTPLSKRTRRCLMKRFPYSVIFRIQRTKKQIEIIDLMHQKQKPKPF